MRKRALTLLMPLALALGIVAAPASGAYPTQTLESQAWWVHADDGGISVPSRVGAHIHVKAAFPVEGTVVTGIVQVPVTVTLHEARGSLNWIRAGTQSGTFWQEDLALGPCHDCTVDLTIPIDTSALPTGRQEIRISANNPDEDPVRSGAQRMFQSTGWQLCVRSCTPTYRSGPFTEARGWYEGADYQNARLESPIAAVVPGATVKVRMAPGSGGRATTFHGAYLDPNFHGGSAGTVIKQGSGSFAGTITIPSDLAPGVHRLTLLASDGQNAGVLVIFFNVGSVPSAPPTASPSPTPSPTPSPVLTPAPSTC